MATRRETLLARAASAQRSSKRLALRDEFDTLSDDDWRNVVIDLAALANAGGGVAVVPGYVDRAHVIGRVARYAGTGAPLIDTHAVERAGGPATAIVVDAAGEAPLLVDQQAYFRHGARSAPATAADLRQFLERRLDLVRKQWLRSIRQVLVAPQGAHVAVVHTDETDEHGVPTLIRLSDDPNAPVYGKLDYDRTHPYRQKEVIAEVNRRLPDGVVVSAYDLLSIRRVHDISEHSRPEFAHVPKFGSPQYSEAFVEWILEQQSRDPRFFTKAKEQYTRTRPRARRG